MSIFYIFNQTKYLEEGTLFLGNEEHLTRLKEGRTFRVKLFKVYSAVFGSADT